MRVYFSAEVGNAKLQVSMDHRVVVLGKDGVSMEEKMAGELTREDKVFQGSVALPLVSVTSHRMGTRLFDITFDPDEPVASFNAPLHGILTLGEPAPLVTDDGF